MREVGNGVYYITRNYVIYAASGVVRVIISRRFVLLDRTETRNAHRILGGNHLGGCLKTENNLGGQY
jgi:hypothetical protein